MLAPVLLLAYLSIARATHTICSWRQFDGHPADQGYTLFCTGELKKEPGDDAHARYWCKELSGVMVADFGYLKPETLEWGACMLSLLGRRRYFA